MQYAQCLRCGAVVPAMGPACPNCGSPRVQPPGASATGSGCVTAFNLIGGFCLLLLAVIVYFFAESHDIQHFSGYIDCERPVCTLTNAPDSRWFFSRGAMTTIKIGVGLSALLGVFGLVQGFILQAKAKG